MPSPPQWSYLIDKDYPIKRRRVSNAQSSDWFSPTSFRTNRSTRFRRYGFRPRRSFHSSSKIPHFRTIEDSVVLIDDSSDDESALDKVPNISTDELNCSNIYIEECVNNGDARENPVCDSQLIDIIDDEMAKEVANASPVVVSEDSDVEVVESNPVFSPKLNKELNNPQVESFIAESELDPQVMVLLDLPSKKELRTRTSSRLATLLRRLESEKVVRRHMRSKKSGTTYQHESQIFTIKSVVLPSSHFTSTEHVILNTTQNDILVLPATYFSPSQWALVQRANSLKCFLNVTLTQPWREMPLQDTDSARIIFSPSVVDVQEIPVNTTVPDLQRVPLLCECIRQDPKGNTWSLCPHRFGNLQSNQGSLEQLCTSRCTQLQFLVLNKSLLWFEKRLRFAYFVKQSTGTLSIFILPFQPSRLDMDGVEIIVTPDKATPIIPGCVYSVKKMPIKPFSSDPGLCRKALSLCESLTDFLEQDERLTDFTSPSVDIDATNDTSIFLLKNSDKLHFTLQMSAFSETAVLPTYSPFLTTNSRCFLTGILLHEFPSGSAIADEFLTALEGISSLQNATGDDKISSIFTIYSEEKEEVYLVLCTHDAVTPLALINASNRLDYRQHQACRVKLSLVGAVVVFRGVLILNTLSRIDLIEIQESSSVEQFDDDVYISPPSFTSKDSKRKNFSLIEMSGVITGVDSSKSQVWPLCPGCLLDNLEETVRFPDNSNGPSSTYQCFRCQAKCDRPFRAVEIVVEMTNINQKRNTFKVSILPSYLATLLKIAESSIYCSASLNPKRLIGQSVAFPFGLLIRLSRFKSDETDVVIQLHPNLFF